MNRRHAIHVLALVGVAACAGGPEPELVPTSTTAASAEETRVVVGDGTFGGGSEWTIHLDLIEPCLFASVNAVDVLTVCDGETGKLSDRERTVIFGEIESNGSSTATVELDGRALTVDTYTEPTTSRTMFVSQVVGLLPGAVVVPTSQ